MPSAGWYPDPSGSGQGRYWDGQEWTSWYDAAPPPSGGRISRGLHLARLSWRVVRDNPVILALVFAGMVGYLIVSAGFFFAVVGRLPDSHDFRFPNYLLVLVALWLGSIASSYCNFAVTVVADRRLHGEAATIADGLRIANQRLGRILSWTLVAGIVGLVLRLVAERLKVGGMLARWVLGVSWGVATVFVVPILALDGTPVRFAIKKSALTFKARWGETVTADAGVSTVLFVALIPLVFICAVLAAVSVPVGITAAVVVLAAYITVGGALGSVLNVVLYRYATDNVALGGFSATALDQRFQRRQPRIW